MFYNKKIYNTLRNHLEQDKGYQQEILSNINTVMGSLRDVSGNPFFTGELKLKSHINFFKNGEPITYDELPRDLQIPLPVYLFGLTDFQSGYPKNREILNPEGWTFQRVSKPNAVQQGVDLIEHYYEPSLWTTNNCTIELVRTHPDPLSGDYPVIALRGDVGIGNPMFATLFQNSQFKIKPNRVYQISYNIVQSGYSIDLGLETWPQTIEFVVQTSPSNYTTLNLYNYETKRTGLPVTITGSGATINFYVQQNNVDLEGDFTIQIGNPIAPIPSLTTVELLIAGLSLKEVIRNPEREYIQGGVSILGYNQASCLSTDAHVGDGIITYIGGTGTDVYVAEIILSCENLPYGTLIFQTTDSVLKVELMRLLIDESNELQFNNQIYFNYYDYFGKTAYDTLNPRLYITPDVFNTNICDLPVNFPIDKNLTIAYEQNFDCEDVNIILFSQGVNKY